MIGEGGPRTGSLVSRRSKWRRTGAAIAALARELRVVGGESVLGCSSRHTPQQASLKDMDWAFYSAALGHKASLSRAKIDNPLLLGSWTINYFGILFLKFSYAELFPPRALALVVKGFSDIFAPKIVALPCGADNKGAETRRELQFNGLAQTVGNGSQDANNHLDGGGSEGPLMSVNDSQQENLIHFIALCEGEVRRLEPATENLILSATNYSPKKSARIAKHPFGVMMERAKARKAQLLERRTSAP